MKFSSSCSFYSLSFSFSLSSLLFSPLSRSVPLPKSSHPVIYHPLVAAIQHSTQISQLLNRFNASKVAALSSQPSRSPPAVTAASGAAGSVWSAKNASKTLARAFWFLNRTIAYNPTNGTQVKALATYTYRRLQFESLLKQGEERKDKEEEVFFLSFALPRRRRRVRRLTFLSLRAFSPCFSVFHLAITRLPLLLSGSLPHHLLLTTPLPSFS